MSRINPDQMLAAHDLVGKLSAIIPYGEHEGHEVAMTAFVAEVRPPRPAYLPEDEPLPRPTTELFFVWEDEWVLAEINPIGRSLR